jgi:hypothetical protein
MFTQEREITSYLRAPEADAPVRAGKGKRRARKT